MITVTTETVSGTKVVKVCGLVEGSTVRARHLGRNITAGIKSLFGGEITEYSELLSEAREEAMNRMVAAAQNVGANAVVNIRFATAEIMSGTTEILAYGTAVVLEDE